MKFLASLLSFALLSGVAQAQQVPIDTGSIVQTVRGLKAGEYVWAPDVAPAGPMLFIVNVRNQRALLYRNGIPIGATTVSTGRRGHETPTGVFTIMRRVANETMNSDTIGIPRFGPGGYYLTNVLFTQYFTGDGASLHYNYWSSMWGYAGSHGCLGLTYNDSAWLWGWAHIGTPVVIHY